MPKLDTPTREDDILALRPLIKSVVQERVADPDRCQDFVQETMARLFEVSERLEARTLRSYAVVTARNMIISHERRNEVEARHAHRVVDPREPEDPQAVALRSEERKAMELALRRIPQHDREVLVSHEVDEIPTATLAVRNKTTTGGVGARLARTRARLRVEYLLAFRGIRPENSLCRQVLLAISAGDARRQRSLDAARHLLECARCASLSAPLLERRRSLAALAPLAAMGRAIKNNPGASAATGAVAAAAIVAAVAQAPSGVPTAPTTQAPASSPLTSEGAPVPWSGSALAQHSGRLIRADSVAVHSVPADEGFWIGPEGTRRVWVHLQVGGESGPSISRAQTVSFSGRVVSHGPSFAERMGLSRAHEVDLLTQQGHHIVVRSVDLDLQ